MGVFKKPRQIHFYSTSVQAVDRKHRELQLRGGRIPGQAILPQVPTLTQLKNDLQLVTGLKWGRIPGSHISDQSHIKLRSQGGKDHVDVLLPRLLSLIYYLHVSPVAACLNTGFYTAPQVHGKCSRSGNPPAETAVVTKNKSRNICTK